MNGADSKREGPGGLAKRFRSIFAAAAAATPDGLRSWVRARFGSGRTETRNVWRGDYSNWEEALAESTGYTSDEVLSKVRDGLLEVRAGRGAYERDSVVFERPEYVWPLVAALSRVAIRDHNRLRVLDFGGSLGSTYFQHRRVFDWLDELTWSVVEQGHFVACGRKEFAGDGLDFFESVDETVAAGSPNVVLLSSVLPYLENPYQVLHELMEQRIPYLIIDRTPFLVAGGRDRLTVQTVPPSIYEASYPTWFFNRQKLLRFLSEKYDLVAEFEALDGEAILHDPPASATYRGWFLERIDRERVRN